MDVNNFLQSEATQFVGTAAANTIGLVIGTIHEDIKELLEIPDEYQAISIVSSRTGTVAQAIAIDDAVKAVNAKLLRFEMAIDAGKQCGQGCLFVLGAASLGVLVKGIETVYFSDRSRSVNDMALRLIRSLNRNVQSCFRTMLSNCSVV